MARCTTLLVSGCAKVSPREEGKCNKKGIEIEKDCKYIDVSAMRGECLCGDLWESVSGRGAQRLCGDGVSLDVYRIEPGADSEHAEHKQRRV